MKIFILGLFLSFSAFAQISTSPTNPTCPTCPVCPVCPSLVEERNSATNREDSFGTLMAGVQYLDTWVPGKVSGSYTQIFTRNFSMELEYATSAKEIDIAGVELGTLSEKRYSLLAMYYFGTSFHISLGPYYNDIQFKLGDKIRDASGNKFNDKVEIAVFGVAFGVGNRWQFNNGFTLGIDWLRINQPTGYSVKERIIKDVPEENQDEVKRTGKLFKNFPAFTFVGINLGYTF